MSVLVKQVEDKLCELVRDAAKKAMAAGELPEAELTDFKVEIPADRKERRLLHKRRHGVGESFQTRARYDSRGYNKEH